MHHISFILYVIKCFPTPKGQRKGRPRKRMPIFLAHERMSVRRFLLFFDVVYMASLTYRWFCQKAVPLTLFKEFIAEFMVRGFHIRIGRI
jgi:hypothetical protein